MVGNIAWNLLVLLYQSGSVYSENQEEIGTETKRLIREMSTKKRTAS